MLYAVELMRRSMDQRPGTLPPPGEHSPEESTRERSFEKAARAPGRSTRRRHLRCSRQPVFKKRRRVASLIIIVLLSALVAGSLLFFGKVGGSNGAPLERVLTPTVERAPELIVEDPSVAEEEPSKEEPSEEEIMEEDAKGTPVPDDPTLYLTVPRLGLYDHTVRNDDSEAALDLGAIKLPRTGFPWEGKDTNTYIACHRLGWPGNESYNQCLNLPSIREGDRISLRDTNGVVYEYRVVETLTVDPSETWVTDPVAGKDMVSLQTCIEAPGDLYTLGPDWSARFVVRAERVEGEQASSLGELVEKSTTAYTGLLRTPSFYHYYGSVLQTTKRVGHYTEVLLSHISRIQVAMRL